MYGSISLLRNAGMAAALVVFLILAGCGDSGSGAGSSAPAGPAAAVDTGAPAGAAPTRTGTAPPSAEMPAAAESSAARETPAVAAVAETPTAKAEPETPAPVPVPETAGGETVPEAEGAAPEPIPQVAMDGGEVYVAFCAVCHHLGLNAAPKYGNKLVWGPRLANGKGPVYANALNGLRAMPPRGGFATLTDDQVKAAVDYMVNGSGGWGSAQ